MDCECRTARVSRPGGRHARCAARAMFDN